LISDVNFRFTLQPHPYPFPLERGRGEVKKITIHKIEFQGLSALSSKELFGRLLMDVSKVRGDFRQHEILVLWNKILEGYREDKIFLGRFSARVSSGTYIRGIVNDMGNTLGIGATTLSIRRTRVGDYKIEDSLL
jgi:tRNA U55 pseudouridine synthase TruB